MRDLLHSLQHRLHADIGRSPLLRLQLARQARLLDITELGRCDAAQPRRLLEALIAGRGLNLQFQVQPGATVSAADAAAEHALFVRLQRRIRNEAERGQRETGVHGLWLGYPFIQLGAPPDSREAPLLAPVLLWPLQLLDKPERQGALHLKPAAAAGGLRVNQALWAWARRHLSLQLPELDPELQNQPAAVALQRWLNDFSSAFLHLQPAVWDAPPEALPAAAAPQSALLHSGVIGAWRWPHEAVLDDLEALQAHYQDAAVPATALQCLTRSAPPQLSPAVPAEAHSYLVEAADASQADAVWHSRSADILIHGPPGTGKSQTIVNLIADALARGERVLLVCQKQAALDVVEKRLHACGLGGLALRVRDAEADRLNVFRNLRAQVERLPVEADPRPLERLEAQRQDLSERIEQLESELDRFAAALHQPCPHSGLSYPQILTLGAEQQARFPALPRDTELLRLLKSARQTELHQLARQFSALGAQYQAVNPDEHPWQARRSGPSYAPEERAQLEQQFQHIQQLDAAQQREIRAQREHSSLAPSLLALPQLRARLQQLLDSPQTTPLRHWLRALLPLNAWGRELHAQRVAALGARLQQTPPATPPGPWAQSCASLSGAEQALLLEHCDCLQRHARRWWRWLLPCVYRARQAVQPVLGDEQPDGVWLESVAQLRAYLRARQQEAESRVLWQTLVPGLAYLQPGSLADWQVLQESFQLAATLCRDSEQQPWLRPFLEAFCAGADDLPQQLSAVTARETQLHALHQALDALAPYLPAAQLQAWRDTSARGDSIAAELESWRASLHNLADLMRWENACADLDLREARIFALLRSHSIPENTTAAEWWTALLHWHGAQAWRQAREAAAPQLTAFDPAQHQAKRRALAQALEQKRILDSRWIAARWQQAQIPHRAQPWKRWLQLRSSHLNQAKRLREAVELSWEQGLLDLRPCWLLNPETAARVLPLQAALFDRVIFDEASQCPLEEALPALFRARRAVVCGDEQQLPPSRFFSAAASLPPAATLSPLCQDLLQAEDLLQAVNGKLSEAWLQVHYRSRHPALIEFSNQAFYHGLLQSPPAQADWPATRAPLRYHAINGVYEQRRNRAEAAAVIEILRELWRETSGVSVGIVSFNQPQQELIEDCLAAACAEDAAFAAAYAQATQEESEGRDEPLFVKNLENVQGDERDLILFSTTFGPDRNGAFARRFGPLGAAGGERRLNVAVTRAREQVIVLTSLPLAELDDEDGSYRPSAYLGAYLRYAQAISAHDTERAQAVLNALRNETTTEPEPPPAAAHALSEAIQTRLLAAGLPVQNNAAQAGLASCLSLPAATGRIGIDCDGPPWHPDSRARHREIWRQELLKQRGWQLLNVWSSEWWTDSERVLERVREAVSSATSTESENEN